MMAAMAFLFLSAMATSRQTPSAPPNMAAARGGQFVDAIAVRIEDDIITESEVRELEQFQQLVDGHSQPRDEVIKELIDQWIVRNEANTTKFPTPSAEDVQHEYDRLVMQFHSGGELNQKLAAAGLSEMAVRRMLEQQIFLARFLDYRFRPAAEVGQSDIENYYEKELVPELKAKNQTVPPLDDVTDSIREVLTQRAIGDSSTKWLDDSRTSLRIDISPEPKP